jgi:hypothetical protein
MRRLQRMATMTMIREREEAALRRKERVDLRSGRG